MKQDVKQRRVKKRDVMYLKKYRRNEDLLRKLFINILRK